MKYFGKLALLTLALALSVSAQQGTPHGVLLSWPAGTTSGSSAIAGYNIYRCTNGNATACTTAGAFIKIDTSLDVSLGYLDQSALTPGVAYSYVVTTVDTAGNESAYSVIASVTFAAIPNPNAPSGCNAKVQ